jgi:hypothetical protein
MLIDITMSVLGIDIVKNTFQRRRAALLVVLEDKELRVRRKFSCLFK